MSTESELDAINERLDRVEVALERLETRLTHLTTLIDDAEDGNEGASPLEKQMDSLEARVTETMTSARAIRETVNALAERAA